MSKNPEKGDLTQNPHCKVNSLNVTWKIIGMIKTGTVTARVIWERANNVEEPGEGRFDSKPTLQSEFLKRHLKNHWNDQNGNSCCSIRRCCALWRQMIWKVINKTTPLRKKYRHFDFGDRSTQFLSAMRVNLLSIGTRIKCCCIQGGAYYDF